MTLSLAPLAALHTPHEPALPTLETIAALVPFRSIDGRAITEVLVELNQAIEAAGIPFGEYGFTPLGHGDTGHFEDYRWIDCAAVPGSNEGYWVHITLVPRAHDRKPSLLIATAKTWSWASALAIAAAATRLLSGY